jgi:glucose/arabinose dehydrogenase
MNSVCGVFPRSVLTTLFSGLLGAFLAHAAGNPSDLAGQVRRGQTLYIAHCSMCHQVTGRGAAGTYPPLAGSDFLVGDRGRRSAVAAVVGGLQGPITVNGKAYNNQMPAVVLDDQGVADVLTFVFNQWGNPGGAFSADEVARIRADSPFKTFADLVKANAYEPLPKAPQGTRVQETVRLNEFVVRIAGDGKGRVAYLLTGDGSVRRLDLATRKITPLFAAADYLPNGGAGISAEGLHLDTRNRLWIVTNHRRDEGTALVTNEVTIHRTSRVDPQGNPTAPKAWFQMRYPWGIGPYNHGASHVAVGPDGRLYLASGSRTDGGERGSDPRLGTMGETDLTAALLRFDPESESPEPEVVARGIRNAWSFAWDSSGHLFSVSNGPDAHACEEMDWIRPPASGESPRHHGFPYQFEDWSPTRAAYPHTPKSPEGVSFVHPVKNLGPDAQPEGRTGWTFSPHSSPAGMVWLDGRWPEAWRNAFLVGRFGNLISGDQGKDAGFDVLSVRPSRTSDAEVWEATTKTFLAPLGRPLDLHLSGGRLYVLEYTRPTDFKSGRGWLPGRILEVEPSGP